jgi:hypothetical protein
MKLYVFRTVRPPIIRSLFTVHSAMVYTDFVESFGAGPAGPARKLSTKSVWRTPLLSVQWINSWWWTDELSETCRVSWQNKFVKLVHLFGFITNIFVMMHGHMNVKYRVNTQLYMFFSHIKYEKKCNSSSLQYIRKHEYITAYLLHRLGDFFLHVL